VCVCVCVSFSNDKHPVSKTFTLLHYTWRTENCLTPTGIRNPGRPVRSAVGMQITQDDVNFSVAARISCRKVVGSCKQRCTTTARRAKGKCLWRIQRYAQAKEERRVDGFSGTETSCIVGPCGKGNVLFVFLPLGIPASEPLCNYIGAGYRYSGHVSSSSSVVSELVFPVSFLYLRFVCLCV